MNYSVWHKRAICPNCGEHFRAPFGEARHVIVHGGFLTACPDCGADGPRDRHWPVETMRWVDTGRLFRPSTWGSGHWERPVLGTGAPA